MKGRCFCNAIQFELQSKVQSAYYCHCRDCQIFSGSAFHVLGVIDHRSINMLQGNMAEFKHHTNSENVMTRTFCPDCGTPLFVRSTRYPEIQMFVLSTLDNPELVAPSFQIWCDSKMPWLEERDGLVSFSRGKLDSQV